MPYSKKTENKSAGRRPVWIGVAILVALFALAAAWKWTPLADFLDLRRMSGWIVSVRQNCSPCLRDSCLSDRQYLTRSDHRFDSDDGCHIWTGARFGVFTGRLPGGRRNHLRHRTPLGQSLVQRIAGKKWQRLEKKIAQSGIVAVAALRLLPVAPFTVVNVVSGAFKVPVRDYTIGSLLGLAPGILVTNLFAHQLENAIRNPGPGTIVILAALIVITGLGAVWFKRKFATA